MEEEKGQIELLQAELENLREELFLAQTDIEKYRNENIALKGFIQNIYESCEAVNDLDVGLEDVLSNLRINIQKLAKAHSIRL
ncbi:MAG: hypothetical protein AAGC88_10310 [Bacteroidota bacterium]